MRLGAFGTSTIMFSGPGKGHLGHEGCRRGVCNMRRPSELMWGGAGDQGMGTKMQSQELPSVCSQGTLVGVTLQRTDTSHGTWRTVLRLSGRPSTGDV